MLKRVLTSAILIALTLGISYSTISQPKAVKVDSKSTIASPNEIAIDGKTLDANRTKERVDAQVQRYVKDYNLTEKQQKEVATILTDFEIQSNELRAKLNSLNKERTDKIEALLTSEQKKMKEDAMKEKRENLIKMRGEVGKADAEKEAPKTVPIPNK